LNAGSEDIAMEEVVAAIMLPITLTWIAQKLIRDDRDAVADSRGAYMRQLNGRIRKTCDAA